MMILYLSAKSILKHGVIEQCLENWEAEKNTSSSNSHRTMKTGD